MAQASIGTQALGPVCAELLRVLNLTDIIKAISAFYRGRKVIVVSRPGITSKALMVRQK